MRTILAQAETGTPDPGVFDNAVLDQFEIPFGQWADQSVDWIDNHLQTMLDAIEWPFQTLIDLLVNDFLAEISWVWFVLGMFVIASLVRTIKVGVFVAGALILCGILGNAYWLETARTIGFIGVAVFLCVLIGIPIGIACGRVDSIWAVVRPVLDAMQVVHSFVYMLPFIFFFGIGETSATMVTMIFALPPLIRLTNLGIRQVPEDVVEASRAYGASEAKVLVDVQLPLARPAIMTGINQTLLLAISMLGIAAIMGAGGLGRLLFRALSNQDVALAASAGLAFYLVALALDRMSQREDTDTGNLFRRIHQAWVHRRDPEALIPDEEAEESRITVYKPVDRYAPISARERQLMAVTIVGGVLAAISVVFEWTSDAGKMSAWGRRVDEDLAGESFNGLAASGGSWFGYLLVFAALFVILAAVTAYLRPGRGLRWLTVDGAVIGSIVMLMLSLIHALASTSELALDPGTGLGVILAVVGSLIATVASVLWLRIAPHSPLRPLSADVAWGPLIGASIAFLFLLMAAFSGWSIDGRADVVITPELQAQLDQLRQDAVERPEDAGAIAAEISAALAEAQAEGAVVTDGVTGDGTRLGLWTLLAGVAALGTVLPVTGVRGRDEHKQWRWGAITAGIGAGIAAVGLAWIFTQTRSADPNYVSGIGAFLATAGGIFVVASVMRTLNLFRRSKVYDDELEAEVEAALSGVEEEVGVTG